MLIYYFSMYSRNDNNNKHKVIIVPLINLFYAQQNLVFYKSLEITDVDTCCLKINGSYIKMAKKLDLVELLDNCLYINSNDRNMFGIRAFQTVPIEIVPIPNTYGTVFIRIFNKANNNSIINISDSLVTDIMDLLMNTIVTINTCISFCASNHDNKYTIISNLQLYHAYITTIINQCDCEVSHIYISSSTNIVVQKNIH